MLADFAQCKVCQDANALHFYLCKVYSSSAVTYFTHAKYVTLPPYCTLPQTETPKRQQRPNRPHNSPRRYRFAASIPFICAPILAWRVLYQKAGAPCVREAAAPIAPIALIYCLPLSHALASSASVAFAMAFPCLAALRHNFLASVTFCFTPVPDM